MIQSGLVVALATLAVGLAIAFALRALPTLRLRLVGLAVLAVCLPLVVVLDGDAREVRKAGDEVALTAREFDLLWFLASHPRRVFSRDQLMTSVWGYEPALETGTVTVHVRRLRRKVEADPARPRHLQTVWGVGYRLVP